METENLKITGVMINYYFICKRKLWYFSKNITMENNSDYVALGKLIDETSFNRNKKHITIENTISIDFIDNKRVIHEIKKSSIMEEAHIWQIKYYLFYLYKKGVDNIYGILDYPKLKKRKKIELEKNDFLEIEKIINDIKKIIDFTLPPEIKKSKICKKCSYYELCYI